MTTSPAPPEPLLAQRRRDYLALASEIARQPIPREHAMWINRSSERSTTPRSLLRSVYLVERYHRRALWQSLELVSTLFLYGAHALFGWPGPDMSLGVCQLRLSSWLRALQVGEITSLSVLKTARPIDHSLRSSLLLLDPEVCIAAAADVLSSILRIGSIPRDCACCLGRLVAREHFGYPAHRDLDVLGIGDLLCLVMRFDLRQLDDDCFSPWPDRPDERWLESPNACTCRCSATSAARHPPPLR
jgi:hypothetical protein